MQHGRAVLPRHALQAAGIERGLFQGLLEHADGQQRVTVLVLKVLHSHVNSRQGPASCKAGDTS